MPLHRIRQGLIPPPPSDQIWNRWFHASFSGNPCRKPGHLNANPQRGRKETTQSRLRYNAGGRLVTSIWLQMCQVVATPCVAWSLALVPFGGSDPSGRFHLQILNIGGPTIIVSPVLDTVAVSLDVEGVIREEQGACKRILHPLKHFSMAWGLVSTVTNTAGP
jgi:hypothetical protein